MNKEDKKQLKKLTKKLKIPYSKKEEMTMTQEDKKLNKDFQREQPKIELAMTKELCEKYKRTSHDTLNLCKEIMGHWDRSEKQWRVMYWIAYVGGIIFGLLIAYNILK